MPIQPQLPAAPINTPWIDESTGTVAWQWRQWMNQFQQGMGFDSSAVAFGPDAQSQNDGIAVGQGSDTGNGTGNVVVGQGATIANGLNNCTIVGQGGTINTTGDNQTIVGQGITTKGANSTTVGKAATCYAAITGITTDNTTVGYASEASGGFCVTVGAGGLSGGPRCTAVGYGTSSGDKNIGVGDCVAVGYTAQAKAVRALAIGAFSRALNDNSITIGCNAAYDSNMEPVASQLILGTAQTDICLGRGRFHTSTAQTTTVHATDGTGTNVAGDDLIIAAGAPTGNATPGIIAFYTSIAGASGSSLRAAAERMRIHTNGLVGIGTAAPAARLHVSGDNDGVSCETRLTRATGAGLSNWISFYDATTEKFRIGENINSAGTGKLVIGDNTNPSITIDSSLNVGLNALINKYNNVTTEGIGVPAIYKKGRSTTQTAAVASVAAYTNGASDGSFIISANANVTTSTTHNFTVTVAYTDETNTARTLTLSFFALSGGAPISSITNVTGAGPYEGAPVHIRCKASTSITIATTGTFTSVTYNVEGYITQIG